MRLHLLTAAAAILVGILTLWFAGGPEGPSTPPQEDPRRGQPPPVLARATPEIPKDLGGSDRVVAHVSTDKPVYRPGERIFARAVLLDAFTRKATAQPIVTSFEVRSARGESVATIQSYSESSVAPFGWEIPQGLAGGSYTLVAKFPHNGYPEAEAAFDIRAYRAPRLRTDLEFLQKAYGPGDEVTAVLSATRAEGGIPSGARVTAVATVDGAEVHRAPLALDPKGGLKLTFRLPGDIAVGNGTLALVIEDGGVHETAAKSIPIVVNRVALSFFPEGGELVGGVGARVYFEARTPKQEPADVSGRILDESGLEVTKFESLHEGRGRFVFTPADRRHYRAVIDKPSGIRDPIALPPVREGFALAAVDDTTPAAKPVRVWVTSPVPAAASVALFLREKELAREAVRLDSNRTLEVSLLPREAADGVLRVTVFDHDGKPRAERLVFRAPDRILRVEFALDSGRASPGGKINVKIRTTDGGGRPVASVVGLSAVDDSVLQTIDKRERAPRLPVQALLGAEVKELKDPAAYLSNDPNAALRLDLLLATQGWRRFAYVEPVKFVTQNDAAGRRMMAVRLPVQAGAFDPVVFHEELELFDANMAGENFEQERFKGDGGGRFGWRFGGRPARDMAGAPAPAPPPPPPVFGLIVPRGDRAGRGVRFGDEADELRKPHVPSPVWGRVYAHVPPPQRGEGRTDFTETVYWNAGLATNEKGEASFSFNVSDAITTFRLRADGFTTDGAFGEADGAVEVRRPFYVEPKFPLEVTAGDRIDLPVSIVNGTDGPLAVQLDTTVGKGLRIGKESSWRSALAGGASTRTVLPILVDSQAGDVELRLRAQAEPHQDDVTRKIRVVPSGFPIEMSFGGVLERIVRHEIAIPDGVEPGSLSTQVGVYPSPLASLTQALAALLQEPGGCFEQTSSSNYPNIMTLQYLKTHSGVDPDLVRRATELAERGYQRLIVYECRNKGYEWFGSDPGHEALTAYGLMEFLDMAQVMNVNMPMIERTREWLLSRRDGKGGFLRDPKALDTFGGAPQDITDAYILWAMTEAGQKGLEKEIRALKDAAQRSDDPYHLALSALVLLNSGDRPSAESLLARLAAKQDKTGMIPGAKTSITRSGGESLEVETVSLAILGWLRSPKHTANGEKAMRWLLERCKGGRFGATQSTILALKAIIAYDVAHARPKKAGNVTLEVDGKAVQSISFPATQEGPIVLGDFSGSLTPGKHVLVLRMEDGADLPYSLQVRYYAKIPAASDKCQVALRTALSKAQVTEGEAVDVTVEVLNRSREGLPMVTAIVGVPGGLEVRADQLKELVREGKVDAYETRGREVILYWRAMAPSAKHVVTLSCVAAVPGEYSGPASRAYLYYTDEHKDWQPGLKVLIPRR